MFTQYSLPTGQSHPADITVGPDGAAWFVTAQAVDHITASGTIGSLSDPSLYVGSYGIGIASNGGRLFFSQAINDPTYFTQSGIGAVTPAGAFSFYGFGSGSETAAPIHLRTMSDGNVWFFDCVFACTIPHMGYVAADGTLVASAASPPTNFFAIDYAQGPDHGIWFTATSGLGPGAAVFRIDESTHALQEFDLPSSMMPGGIVTGPDHNLWFLDSGNNAVVKFSTSGVVLSSYTIPTPNSSPVQITVASDAAMWFTENAGNKIGRIDTAGHITEYATPGSGPYGIVACPSACVNAHGRIWFTQQGANNVVKLEF